MKQNLFEATKSGAISTPRTTRPELFGACQVRPMMRAQRHATTAHP